MEDQGSARIKSASPCLRLYCSSQLDLGKLPGHVELSHVSHKPSHLAVHEYWIESSNDSEYQLSSLTKEFSLPKKALGRWLLAFSGCQVRPTSSANKLHRIIRRFATTLAGAKLVNSGKHQALVTFLGREETRELERVWRSPQMLPRIVLGLKDFSEYEICQLIVHERGRVSAESWGSSGARDLNFSKTSAKNFTKIFNYVKKSKSKLFDQSSALLEDVQVVGNFLAREFSFQNHSALLFLSRNGFLPPTSEELSAFNALAEMVSPYLERLLAREHADERMNQLIMLLENISLPIEIRDQNDSIMFENKSFKNKDENCERTPNIIALPSGCKLILHEESDNSFDIDHHRRVSLLGELLNTLQHELNNPLFGLHLGAHAMAEESQGEVSQTFSDIAANSTRSQTIIKNFSELYSERKSDSIVLLSSFIDEVFILTKSEIRGIKKCVEFIGFENCETYSLKVNPVSLSQILFNLIINAAQAIKSAANDDFNKIRQGEIKLVVKDNGETIRFSVLDNGPGLSASFKANALKPFFTTKKQGTGLGLTISQGLLAAIGSNLEVGDNPSGTGAVFSFNLKVS